MKKILLLFVCLCFLPGLAQAEDCPFGLENDPFPGQCGRYIDQDKDGYCDLSENNIVAAEAGVEANNPNAPIDSSPAVPTENNKPNYNLTLITVLIFAGYFLSWLLVKKNKIQLFAQRKFWNILLFIFFLPTVLTALIYLLRLEYGLTFKLPFNIFYWHIEFGYAMALVSLLHIFWHWPYFKAMINKKNN